MFLSTNHLFVLFTTGSMMLLLPEVWTSSVCLDGWRLIDGLPGRCFLFPDGYKSINYWLNEDTYRYCIKLNPMYYSSMFEPSNPEELYTMWNYLNQFVDCYQPPNCYFWTNFAYDGQPDIPGSCWVSLTTILPLPPGPWWYPGQPGDFWPNRFCTMSKSTTNNLFAVEQKDMAMIICQYIIDPYGYPAMNRTVT
ncbi:uncharacterized protein LOC134854764 [Symsagittifera roscoffensis]|uniref:uncharacterized protein LOC134854764 n=1 Tax=Symsagittifera roscoffensis TaxID=84072 RepID=UPI00307C795D